MDPPPNFVVFFKKNTAPEDDGECRCCARFRARWCPRPLFGRCPARCCRSFYKNPPTDLLFLVSVASTCEPHLSNFSGELYLIDSIKGPLRSNLPEVCHSCEGRALRTSAQNTIQANCGCLYEVNGSRTWHCNIERGHEGAICLLSSHHWSPPVNLLNCVNDLLSASRSFLIRF